MTSLTSSLLRRLETTRLPATGSPGLRARWLTGWSGEIETALSALPPNPMLPVQLFRRLFAAGSARSAIVIVYERNRTMGVLGLRAESGSHWAALTGGWLEAGSSCFARSEDVVRCYLAAGAYIRNLYVEGAWPRRGPIRRVQPVAEYKLDIASAEEYWRKTDNWRKVRKARNRAAELGLRVGVDREGAAEWVISNWSEKWGRQTDLEVYLREGSTYFRSTGSLHCFTLEQDGRPLAGDVCRVNGNTIESICNYREPGVEDTRVLDHIVEWAGENGLSWFNLGPGGLDSYKRKWAPSNPNFTKIDVAPWHIYWPLSLKQEMGRRLLRRGPSGAAPPSVATTGTDSGVS